jgi:Mg2+ and Co2+ transporter CorA
MADHSLLSVFLRDVLDNLSIFDEELREVIRDCAKIDVEAEKYQQRQVDATLYTLTVISAVFLPAQFLTGYVLLLIGVEFACDKTMSYPFMFSVWGMNFENMPELDDQYGYLMFWVLALFLMVSTLLFLNCGRIRA